LWQLLENRADVDHAEFQLLCRGLPDQGEQTEK
jgi:hypothetical protein